MTKNKYPKRGITEEEMVDELKRIYGDRYDYSLIGYKDKQTKIPIICHEVDEYGNYHGVFWSLPYFHINGHGCPICGRNKVTESNRLGKEYVIGKIQELGYEVPSGFGYSSVHSVITLICHKHGKFNTRFSNLVSRNGGCGKCKAESSHKSIMELRISDELNNANIEYKAEYFIPSSLLRLDFYLPQYNCAIECQGIQHFKAVEHFGGDDGFSKTRERDIRKKKLCDENGISVFYYSSYPNDEFLGEKVYHDFSDMLECITNSHNKS